jgi:HlyD family secretion protein
LEREFARLQGEAGALKAARAEAEGGVTEIEIETLGLSSQRREDALTELRDVAARELELAERRRYLAERMARLDIRAPVSGIVLGLNVTTPRAVIRAAEPVLYLIPQDRLHPSAFAGTSAPELLGHIVVVSADALTDESTRLPYYRAEIALDPSVVGTFDLGSLLPGMPVEAFILTGDRTPLSYLVKPFTDYFNRAFRET